MGIRARRQDRRLTWRSTREPLCEVRTKSSSYWNSHGQRRASVGTTDEVREELRESRHAHPGVLGNSQAESSYHRRGNSTYVKNSSPEANSACRTAWRSTPAAKARANATIPAHYVCNALTFSSVGGCGSKAGNSHSFTLKLLFTNNCARRTARSANGRCS